MVINCAICGKEVITRFSGTKYCKECSESVEKLCKHNKRGNIDDIKKLLKQKKLSIYRQTLCWKCENAYGGCPWTEVDNITNRIKFQPVPGWKAEKMHLKLYTENKNGDYSYLVYECPLFIKTPERGK